MSSKLVSPSSPHFQKSQIRNPKLIVTSLDAFAVKLGYSTELAKSLIKLQIQNLATMDADWVYASYHFSHPILPERLGALGWYGEKNKELRQQIKAHKEKGKDEATVLRSGDREL